MSIYQLAQKYYPDLWDKNRLKMLVEANRLTPTQYKEITGEDYE